MRIRRQVIIGLMAVGFRFKTGMTAQFDDTPWTEEGWSLS